MGQSHGGAARKRRISLTSNESELSTSKDRRCWVVAKVVLKNRVGDSGVFFFAMELNSDMNSIPLI